MGTCPACGVRGYPPDVGFTLEDTGDSRLEALPLGTYSVAGAMPKIVAREKPVLRISHECGWAALATPDDDRSIDIHEILPPAIGAKPRVIAASIRLALTLAVGGTANVFTVEPVMYGNRPGPIRVTRTGDGAHLDITEPLMTGTADVWRITDDPEPASFEELVGRLSTWVRA